jgi:DNA-binding CsgD family transcriptional regulator
VIDDDRRSRARDQIERLAQRGHETVHFWQEATEVLRSVVPFDFEPCWYTLDPDTLMITGHSNSGLRETPKEVARSQYVEDDVNRFSDLARSHSPATTVSAATRGDPAASWRWRNLLVPAGFDDALDAVLRSRGTTWGALSLLHISDRAPFTRADIRFIAQVSPALATGTRLGLLLSSSVEQVEEPPPAVLLVDPDLSVVSVTPAASGWLEDLADNARHVEDSLPVSVQVAVLRATSGPDGEAAARVRGRSGRWAHVHASRLVGGPAGLVAVVIESARESLTRPLLLHAHALTVREREVVDLVLRGRSTDQIAAMLFLSPYTVQDRLKAVFEKLGVRSRRELVAQIHASDFQPLIDDNDARLRAGRPLSTASTPGPG